MNELVRETLLYDFYGELLTEHQKRIYEEVKLNDMSYSEVADIENISRQAVYDMIRRCKDILEDYETKLQLVERFDQVKEKLDEIQGIIDGLKLRVKDADIKESLDVLSTKTEEIIENI